MKKWMPNKWVAFHAANKNALADQPLTSFPDVSQVSFPLLPAAVTSTFVKNPKVFDDLFASASTGPTEDSTEQVFLNVTANDAGGRRKVLWSVDDAGPLDDLLTQDTIRSVKLGTDTSANGATIWITADGQIGSDALPLNADVRARLDALDTAGSKSMSEQYLFSIANAVITCVFLRQQSSEARRGWRFAVSRQGIEGAGRVQAIARWPQPWPCGTQGVAARRTSTGGAVATVGQPMVRGRGGGGRDSVAPHGADAGGGPVCDRVTHAKLVIYGSLAISRKTIREEIAMHPDVTAFFDEPTNTVSYVVKDPASDACAIVDSVLDFDNAAGRTATQSADAIIAHVRERGLRVEWLLETHVHADHLSAAPYLQRELGGKIGIGENIRIVQDTFGKIFNAGTEFQRDGSQFDRLFREQDRFQIGGLSGFVLHTPGHTPACLTYVIGDAAFVGDTLFMPDFGTARCDFPGGSAEVMWASVQKILSLPDETRIFVGHDYKAPGREVYAWETTVGEQKARNVHIAGNTVEGFVKTREARDKTLGMPKLIIPSIQVNMRAGRMPPAEENGTVYLKVPVNTL